MPPAWRGRTETASTCSSCGRCRPASSCPTKRSTRFWAGSTTASRCCSATPAGTRAAMNGSTRTTIRSAPGTDIGPPGFPARTRDHPRAQVEQDALAPNQPSAPGCHLRLQPDVSGIGPGLRARLARAARPRVEPDGVPNRDMTDFSMEPFEFVAEAKRWKTAPPKEALLRRERSRQKAQNLRRRTHPVC